MIVTPRFRAQEFACKDGTPYPIRWLDTRLRKLCLDLEVIRAAVEAPITIVSGFRTAEYNKRIGGALASQHVTGRAADITARGIPAPALHEVILQLWKDGKLTYVMGIGEYPRWVHVDVRPSERLVRWSGSRVGG